MEPLTGIRCRGVLVARKYARSTPHRLGDSQASIDDLEWDKDCFRIAGDPAKSLSIRDMRCVRTATCPEGVEGGLEAQIHYNPKP